MESEKFRGGQPVVETKIFGEEADLAADFDVCIRMAEDLRLAAGGLDEGEKHFDGGAFAGAVGAEETKDFAATDLERKTTNRHLGAELFAKADGFDGQVIGRRQRVLRFRQCGPYVAKIFFFCDGHGTAEAVPSRSCRTPCAGAR